MKRASSSKMSRLLRIVFIVSFAYFFLYRLHNTGEEDAVTTRSISDAPPVLPTTSSWIEQQQMSWLDGNKDRLRSESTDIEISDGEGEEGKYCQEVEGGGKWSCKSCSATAGSCIPIEPTRRNSCPGFPVVPWDGPPPRSSTRRRSFATKMAHANALTHYGLRDTQYEQLPCRVSYPCFNLRRCSADGPLDVFAYNINASYAGMVVKEAARVIPHVVRVAHDPSTACLLVLSPHIFASPAELLASPTWNHGENHYVWHSNYMFDHHGDRPFGGFNFEKAALASPSFMDANVRVGFDTPIHLKPLWTRNQSFPDRERAEYNNNNNADRKRRKRPILVSFKGQILPWEQRWWQHRWLAASYWEEADDVVVDVKCAGYNKKNDKGYDNKHDYGELLLSSTFSFVPGGGSVTSFRVAEVLSAGAIPVATAEHLMPFQPEIDWTGCVVTVSEERIVDIPRILRRIPDDEIERRRSVCAKLFLGVIGEKQHEQGKWADDDHVTSFIVAMKIWRARISAAIYQEEQLERIQRDAMTTTTSMSFALPTT